MALEGSPVVCVEVVEAETAIDDVALGEDLLDKNLLAHPLCRLG